MKGGAIARIIIWSLVALVLTGLLVSVMMMKDSDGNIFSGFGFSIGSGGKYANADEYSVGDASITDKITSAEINWVNGKVTVCSYDGDTVEINETATEDDDEKLRYLVKDGKLTVQPRKSGWFFGIRKTPEKELTVKLPKDIAENLESFKCDSVSASLKLEDISVKSGFEVDNISGTVALKNITADKIDIDNVSGEITAANCKADTFESDTVSGEITAEGEFSHFDSDSTSGDLHLISKTPLKSLSLDSVSGSGVITLPEDSGFSVDFDSVSGDLDCDFPTVSKNGEKICGNGSGNFEIDTTSGDFSIKKLQTEQ